MQYSVLIYRTRYIIIWEKEIIQHKLPNFPAANQKLSRNKEETKNGSERRIDKVHIKFIRGGHEKIIQRLPELISKLEAQGLPCHLLRELHQTSVGVNS